MSGEYHRFEGRSVRRNKDGKISVVAQMCESQYGRIGAGKP